MLNYILVLLFTDKMSGSTKIKNDLQKVKNLKKKLLGKSNSVEIKTEETNMLIPSIAKNNTNRKRGRPKKEKSIDSMMERIIESLKEIKNSPLKVEGLSNKSRVVLDTLSSDEMHLIAHKLKEKMDSNLTAKRFHSYDYDNDHDHKDEYNYDYDYDYDYDCKDNPKYHSEYENNNSGNSDRQPTNDGDLDKKKYIGKDFSVKKSITKTPTKKSQAKPRKSSNNLKNPNEETTSYVFPNQYADITNWINTPYIKKLIKRIVKYEGEDYNEFLDSFRPDAVNNNEPLTPEEHHELFHSKDPNVDLIMGNIESIPDSVWIAMLERKRRLTKLWDRFLRSERIKIEKEGVPKTALQLREEESWRELAILEEERQKRLTKKRKKEENKRQKINLSETLEKNKPQNKSIDLKMNSDSNSVKNSLADNKSKFSDNLEKLDEDDNNSEEEDPSLEISYEDQIALLVGLQEPGFIEEVLLEGPKKESYMSEEEYKEFFDSVHEIAEKAVIDAYVRAYFECNGRDDVMEEISENYIDVAFHKIWRENILPVVDDRVDWEIIDEEDDDFYDNFIDTRDKFDDDSHENFNSVNVGLRKKDHTDANGRKLSREEKLDLEAERQYREVENFARETLSEEDAKAYLDFWEPNTAECIFKKARITGREKAADAIVQRCLEEKNTNK